MKFEFLSINAVNELLKDTFNNEHANKFHNMKYFVRLKTRKKEIQLSFISCNIIIPLTLFFLNMGDIKVV